jgi:glycosyltransferase involved in cell wall biosynthesis
MRVVFVNKFVHVTGGADQHCLGLAAALRARGHEVRFLSTSGDENVEHEGEFVTTRVTHGSRESLTVVDQARVLTNALWNREAAAAMEDLVREFRPDVVHAHKLYPQLSVAPVVVAARHRVPVVQTLHDFELVSASLLDVRGGRLDRDETRFRFRLLNEATLPVRRGAHVRRVSIFIAVSRFVARVYARYGIVAEVLPNFVPVHDGHGRLQFDDRDGVVFWGRLRPEKGVDDVIEMAKLLPGHSVVIAGSGMLEDHVRRETASLPNVHVTGYVPNDQLAEIVRKARVVVVPSRCHDAGPLVPLEALGQGTPVVAYANGGLAEYVVDTGGGRIVPVDPVALAAVAAELHDDRETWESHSSRGHAAVTESRTPDAYAARLEQLYEKARSRRRNA